MNDDELRQRLQRFKTPDASESARGRARHRALIAFQQGNSEQTNKAPRPGFGLLGYGGFVVAFVGVVAAFFALRHPAAPENVVDDRQLLQQTEKLFPNQVNAVVDVNGKVDLSISQSAEIGSSQPVLVVFKRGENTIRVLSYSGHRVCLMLGGNKKCLEILATPTGGIILEGDDRVWLASEHPHIAGYSVLAQSLEASL